jgi:hypothetical protein
VTQPAAQQTSGPFVVVAEGWHLCVLAGLTTPQAAGITDGIGILLALYACAQGRPRTAATLSAAAAASAAAIALLP